MRINARLNTRDINNVIKQIERFKSDLEAKIERFLSELADVGIQVAKANTSVEYDGNYVNMGDMLDFSRETVVDDDGTTCILTVTGRTYTKEWVGGSAEVNPLLMAEFGSGSKAIDGHRGTFPNQHVAFLESWKWKDKSGQEHESSGNVPSRPMLRAKEEMESQIHEVAERVFSA